MDENEKIMIMDFSDGILHDKNWAMAQPPGRLIVVEQRLANGVDEFSIALGEGRDGTNALRIRCLDANAKSPGVWVIIYEKTLRGLRNNSDETGYLVPRGKKPNRMHIWVKFPKGYGQSSSEKIPTGTPHRNMHIGTYHYDPGQLNSERVVETNNWHGYHQIALRHDLAQDQWMHVVVNSRPCSQRSRGGDLCANYCADSGDYWDLATRFYIDSYTTDFEYPTEMLIDSIYLTYEEEEKLVEININDFKEGEIVEVLYGEKREFDVTVKNLTDREINGRLSSHITWQFGASLENPINPKRPSVTNISLKPNETKSLKLWLNPYRKIDSYLGGLLFVPEDQMTKLEGKYYPSHNDPNVGFAFYEEKAIPIDAKLPDYKQVRFKMVDTLSNTFVPVSRGGQFYETGINQEYNGKLEGFTRNNTPLNFIFVPQKYPSKGGKFTLNPDGTFNFVPDKDFEGCFLFRYKINDGVTESKNYGSWILVKKTEKKELTDKEIIDFALNNLKIKLNQEIQKSVGISLFFLNRVKMDLEKTSSDSVDKELVAFALEEFKPLVEKTAQDLNANLDLARIDQIITKL